MPVDPLDIWDLPALRIVLVMYEGEPLTDEWTWKEVMLGESPQWIHFGPPPWLLDPEMIWKDSRLPITVRGNVPTGYERLAHELLVGGRYYKTPKEDND